MKTIKIERYECDICHQGYETAEAARACESRPVKHDKGVKIGDEVLITGGDGRGLRCKVETIGVHDKDWGRYASERYWHTVFLTGKVVDSWGHRQLSYDQYEVLPAVGKTAAKANDNA